MKKLLTHWTLAFVTLTIMMLWGLKDPFVKETARLKSFDLIQKYDTATMSEDIIIVEIDEKSIEQNGQWPWRRSVLADVIWKLREAGAGIIVLPVLFTEEDRLGGDMDLMVDLRAMNGDPGMCMQAPLRLQGRVHESRRSHAPGSSI